MGNKELKNELISAIIKLSAQEQNELWAELFEAGLIMEDKK